MSGGDPVSVEAKVQRQAEPIRGADVAALFDRPLAMQGRWRITATTVEMVLVWSKTGKGGEVERVVVPGANIGAASTVTRIRSRLPPTSAPIYSFIKLDDVRYFRAPKQGLDVHDVSDHFKEEEAQACMVALEAARVAPSPTAYCLQSLRQFLETIRTLFDFFARQSATV